MKARRELTSLAVVLFGAVAIGAPPNLPNVDDPEVQALFENPETYWYDEQNMPPAFQFRGADPVQQGFHSPFYKLGPDKIGMAHGFEWPWVNPHQPDFDGTVGSYKGLLLPNSKPVVVYSSLIPTAYGSPQHVKRSTRWRFPKGTKIIEVVTVDGVPFKALLMELRDVSVDDGWHRKLFRPFPTLGSYEQAAGTVGGRVTNRNLQDTRHPVRRFNETSQVVSVPAIDPSEAKRLLRETVFKECLETEFIPGGGYMTTSHRGQVVPRNYLGAFLGGSQTACQNCHRDTLMHVSLIQTGRDWYGSIRGDHSVLSFHPADPSCISTNGFYHPFRMNRDLERRRIIARFDRSMHSFEDYGIR